MKKIVNVATPAVCAVALILSVAAFTKTNAATASAPAPVMTSAPAGQPVDLTYAAEKALPSVTRKSRPSSITIPSRTSSLILSADSSAVDRVTMASASARYRLQSAPQPVQV